MRLAARVPPVRCPLDELLLRLVELGGQDLFVIPGAPPTVAVEKRLVPIREAALTGAETSSLAAPFLEPHAAAFEARPDLDLAHGIPGRGRFRLSIFRERGEVALVARRVKLEVPTLAQLGLPPILAHYALELRGLFLVTGAAAQGKSTTLAAMVARRSATLPGHVVTIEDPIEFVHPHGRSIVTQREVGIDTASFHDALRSALRQSPDVLLVGEVRDRETAEAVLHFAETGHLVLATVHGTNAIQAIERLVDLFPPELHRHALSTLAGVLVGIAAQRLVPRASGDRVAAVEVLVPTQRVRDFVRRGDLQGVRAALDEGGEATCSFDDALRALVRSGKLTREEAVLYADGPADFQLRFRLDEATGPGKEGRRFRLI